MKIPNKRELQQTTFNHSSGIVFREFMNLLEKTYKKTTFFLVVDASLALGNPLHLRKNILEKI